MDSLTIMRRAIKRLLSEIVDRGKGGFVNADAQTFGVFDEEHDQYLVLHLGWQKLKRVRGIMVHCRIVDNCVWIEENWTERDLRDELITLGVPADRIVLGFIPPILRDSPEPAVA